MNHKLTGYLSVFDLFYLNEMANNQKDVNQITYTIP